MNCTSSKTLLLLAAVALCSATFIRAADEPMDEYEPPPEGFEERHYPITGMMKT
jgi:hypothetical protein